MATAYENPQAAMNVLMGGPPTPEEQEIASRILATDGGLPQALENMGAEPNNMNAAPSTTQMAQTVPVPNQIPPTMVSHQGSAQREEALGGWLIINQDETVPWDENITWGQYLGKVYEEQGKEAVDAIIEEQLQLEDQKRVPPESPKEFPMPVLPEIPQPDPNQQVIAGAPPGSAPPAPPVTEQGGIMTAANGGLVGFANGGMNGGDELERHFAEIEAQKEATQRRAMLSAKGLMSLKNAQLDNELKKAAFARNVMGLSPGAQFINFVGGDYLPEDLNLLGGLDNLKQRIQFEKDWRRASGPIEGYGSNIQPRGLSNADIRAMQKPTSPVALPPDFAGALTEADLAGAMRAEDARQAQIRSEEAQLDVHDPSGYALGGIVGAPQGAPVSEDEFMSVISQLSGEAGIPEGQLDAVAEVATQTAGDPAAANDNVMDSGIMQTVEAVDATDEELAGIGSLAEMNAQLVAAGEEGLVHATPGELIFDPSRLNEPDQRMVLAALETAGIDPNSATVGNEANILNKMTGLPAFGFFSKIFKGVGKAVKKVGKFLKRNAGTILGIAGAMTGNPLLAALGSGIGSLIEGKPIQSALLSAGMSFAGTKWVGPWIGKQLQGIGSLGIGEGMKTPVGDVLTGSGLSGRPGSWVTNLTEAGGKQLTAERLGAEAATRTILGAGEELSKEAVLDLAETAASDVIAAELGTNFGAEAIKKGAERIAQGAFDNIAAGSVTKVAGTVVPQRVFTSAGTRFFSQPIGDLAGSAIAGGAQMMAEPYLQGMVGGVPQADQQAVLDAWNQRYDYTPSSEELYTFYTNEYAPNQQVNVAQTIGGIPGYGSPVLAAGGGYINGVGGPKSDSNLARLSDGEFVMTEAAVRGAGYGDRMAGARRMYDIMNGLERRVA